MLLNIHIFKNIKKIVSNKKKIIMLAISPNFENCSSNGACGFYKTNKNTFYIGTRSNIAILLFLQFFFLIFKNFKLLQSCAFVFFSAYTSSAILTNPLSCSASLKVLQT